MRRTVVAVLALIILTSVQASHHVQAQSVTYAPGWNLVAGPQGAHLSGATGLLYTLQPGDTDYESMPASSPLTACRGYWAYFPSGGSIDFGPSGNASANCAVTISPAQFVMMGDPSSTASAPVSGADLVYTYSPDGGYQVATQLSPGQGAWVYAAGAVSITTAATSSSAPTGAAQPAPQPVATTAPAPSTGIAGPLALSASLSTSTCTGGNVRVTVVVTDANGRGVAGATVTGNVQYKTTGHSFSFPATDVSGSTSTTIDTGRPRGGYNVVWTFTASAGGLSTSGSTTCYAP